MLQKNTHTRTPPDPLKLLLPPLTESLLTLKLLLLALPMLPLSEAAVFGLRVPDDPGPLPTKPPPEAALMAVAILSSLRLVRFLREDRERQEKKEKRNTRTRITDAIHTSLVRLATRDKRAREIIVSRHEQHPPTAIIINNSGSSSNGTVTTTNGTVNTSSWRRIQSNAEDDK